MLWIILGGAGAMVVMLVLFRSVLPAWKQTNGRIVSLEDEIEAKEREVSLIAAEKTRRESAKILPLSGSIDRAAAEYARYLKPLLHDAGLTVDEFQGPPPVEPKSLAAGQKKPSVYQMLPYQIRAKGDLPSLTYALENMRRTPVMHRVKSLTLDRLDPKDTIAKLGIQMTVEVLVNPAGKSAPKLMPYPDPRMVPMDSLAVLSGLPAGALLNPWTAEGLSVTQGFRYPHATTARVNLSKLNPFLGELPPPPPVVAAKEPEPEPEPTEPEGPDLREYVKLDTIVPPTEAFFRNTYIKQAPIRIKSTPMSGYEIFRIMDEDRSRTIVRGKVLKIDPRVVYFQVGEDIYGILFGQTLADAMKRPLSPSELDDSGVGDLFDSAFAEPPEAVKKKTPTRKKL
jgi:hypothetical protein